MAEKLIKIYDPGVNAYRSVTIEVAKKFIASAKLAEKEIENLEE